MSDLLELFARDPLTMTREDISSIVDTLRKNRGQFNLGSMKAGTVKAPTSARAKAVAELSKSGLSLNFQSLISGKINQISPEKDKPE